MEQKTCSKCQTLKSIEDFRWKDKSKGKRQSQCKSCSAENCKSWYARNAASHKTNVIANNRQRVLLNREYVASLKLACEQCGEDHPGVLDFHHLDPSTKEGTVSDIAWSSLDRLTAEIAKCVCWCSNCHRKHHWEERNTGSVGQSVGPLDS